MISFDTYKLVRNDIMRDMAAANAALQEFPRSAIGLTPDSVKALPEFQAAKIAYGAAFERLRQWNATHLKRFSRELRNERRRA